MQGRTMKCHGIQHNINIIQVDLAQLSTRGSQGFPECRRVTPPQISSCATELIRWWRYPVDSIAMIFVCRWATNLLVIDSDLANSTLYEELYGVSTVMICDVSALFFWFVAPAIFFGGSRIFESDVVETLKPRLFYISGSTQHLYTCIYISSILSIGVMTAADQHS